MPKKMGVNTKAEVARTRRSAAKADRHDRNARTKGEAYWQAAKGPKSRSARRHEEDTENRRLAELEQQQLAAATSCPDRKATRVGGPFVAKVTKTELLRHREEERLQLEREVDAAKKQQVRTVDEEFERVVLVANTNRDDSIIEARSVEDPSWCDESTLPPDRYPATPSAVSRSRTRLLIDFIWKFSGSHLADNAGALEHTRESFHLLYFCKLVFLEASPFAYATLLPISNCEFCVLEE